MRGKAGARSYTHIYERSHRSGGKTWVIRWKDPKSGRWLSQSAGKTAEEAAIVESGVRKNLALGLPPFPEMIPGFRPITFTQIAERFYESPKFLAAKTDWATEARRKITKEILPQFGKTYFSDLTKDKIIKFYLRLKGKGLTHATIEKYHAIMGALGDVHSDLSKENNVVREIRDFKKFFPDQPSSRDINFLTPEELESLFQSAKNSKCRELWGIIKFLSHTGLRRSEALSLQWKDIDFEGGFIHIRKSKSGRSRMVPIEDGALDALKCIKRTDALVFIKMDGSGSQYNKRYFLKPLKHAAMKAGISKRIDLHTLRHSFGSNKIRQGWGLKKVSVILGHADINITSKVYTHLLDGDLKVRDDFAFDFKTSSANDGKLKDWEMSTLLCEVIHRLTLIQDGDLESVLDRSICESLPKIRAGLTQSSEQKDPAISTLNPIDSTRTSETAQFVAQVLRKNLGGDALDAISQSHDKKKPHDFNVIGPEICTLAWRPHGDSNPGYRRERAMS